MITDKQGLGAARSDPTKVLITGASGFVGRHLVAALERAHADWHIDAPASPGEKCALSGLDVTNEDAVTGWIIDQKPDIVVHLAAMAAVTDSVKDPRTSWKVNFQGTLNLVLALQEHAPDAHLLMISSAEVYGESLNSLAPTDEQALLRPVNPYAASKAAADILVRQAIAGGMSATVMRPFNHIGPGQSHAFVAPNFASQISRIEAGLQLPVISVGNLEEERDFLDVTDVVAAYQLVMERRREPFVHGVFNVASGVGVRIGDILERLLSLARVKIDVIVDPSRFRRVPISRVIGDASCLRSLGWTPTISLSESLSAVLQESRRLAC